MRPGSRVRPAPKGVKGCLTPHYGKTLPHPSCPLRVSLRAHSRFSPPQGSEAICITCPARPCNPEGLPSYRSLPIRIKTDGNFRRFLFLLRVLVLGRRFFSRNGEGTSQVITRTAILMTATTNSATIRTPIG